MGMKSTTSVHIQTMKLEGGMSKVSLKRTTKESRVV